MGLIMGLRGLWGVADGSDSKIGWGKGVRRGVAMSRGEGEGEQDEGRRVRTWE